MTGHRGGIERRAESVAGAKTIVDLAVGWLVGRPCNRCSGAGEAGDGNARDRRGGRVGRGYGAIDHGNRLSRDDQVVIPGVSNRMRLVGILVGVVRRQLELTKAVAVDTGPVDFGEAIIDDQLAVHPQLNATGGIIGTSAELDAAGEFHPLVGDEMGAGGVQRSVVVGLGVESGSRATLYGVGKGTADDVLHAIIIAALLPIHLRNAALVAVVHGDFYCAGAESIGRVAVPDGLLEAGAGSADALEIGGQEVRVEFLIELEIQDIAGCRSRRNIREGSIRIALERLGEKAAGIGTALGRNGEFQRSGAGMGVGGGGVNLWEHTLPVLNHGGRVAGSAAGVSERIVGLSGESAVARCSGRPVVIKSAAAVEAEAVEVAGLIALLAEGGVYRADGKREGGVLRHRAGRSRYRDGILSNWSRGRGG